MITEYLIHTIDEIYYVSSTDKYGKPVYTLLVTNVPCRKEVGVIRAVTTGGVNIVTNVVIYIEPNENIQPQCKLKIGVKYYEVVSADPFYTFDEAYTVLSCVDVAA